MRTKWKPIVSRITVAGTGLLLIGYIAYQYIYPTLVCDGQRNLNKVWRGGAINEPVVKVLEDKKSQVSASFLIRRGAVFINEDRFPLYKELNGTNRFAEQTLVGYKGRWSEKFIQEVRQEFQYNRFTTQLSVETSAKAPHILDGEVGVDHVKLDFSGMCYQKWILVN